MLNDINMIKFCTHFIVKDFEKISQTESFKQISPYTQSKIKLLYTKSKNTKKKFN